MGISDTNVRFSILKIWNLAWNSESVLISDVNAWVPQVALTCSAVQLHSNTLFIMNQIVIKTIAVNLSWAGGDQLVEHPVLSHAVGQCQACSGTQAPLMLVHKYMDETACHVGHQKVSRCHTRGESEESAAHRWWSMQLRESTLALKPRAEISRSPKQWYQWPHKKDLYVYQTI